MKSTTNNNCFNKYLLRVFFALSFLSVHDYLSAQEIYTYDAVGNRIKRTLFVCSGCLKIHNNNDTVPKKEAAKAAEIAIQHGISVYPNPANEMVSVAITGIMSGEKATIEVMDESGRLLTTFQSTSASNQVDMTKYGAGIYFVKVTVGSDPLFYRVIKSE